MNSDLKNKIAFVSGSSQGIGKAIAERLCSEGCIVFINGREDKKLQDTLKELKDKTGNEQIYSIMGDLTSVARIKEALHEIQRQAGTYPELAVSNIGSGSSVGGWDISDVEWQRMFDLNFFGPMRFCTELIRVMKEHGGGSIVCISSIAGCEAIPAPLPYSTAKTALLSFVKNTSNITAGEGIRINAVSPGNVLIPNGTWEKKLAENKEEVMGYINASVPMKGFASPNDVAHMVTFLLSKKAAFITGSNMIVDGGQVKKF